MIKILIILLVIKIAFSIINSSVNVGKILKKKFSKNKKGEKIK